MNGQRRQSLLRPSDPPPVQLSNPDAGSPFVLLGDHAGKAIPSALGTLGLDQREQCRHIAWDIGTFGLGTLLADALDAVFISQAYSRLVVDCNRDPAAADAIVDRSDRTVIPANRRLAPKDRAARFAAIHEPYHRAIEAQLAQRDQAGQPSVLISLHSFTPRLGGRDRPWHAGVLHERGNTAFATRVLSILGNRRELNIGDNEPYAMNEVDYTIPRHAYPAERSYLEIEIRQDGLGTSVQQRRWADILSDVLPSALSISA